VQIKLNGLALRYHGFAYLLTNWFLCGGWIKSHFLDDQSSFHVQIPLCGFALFPMICTCFLHLIYMIFMLHIIFFINKMKLPYTQ